jgi:hypothetical protein
MSGCDPGSKQSKLADKQLFASRGVERRRLTCFRLALALLVAAGLAGQVSAQTERPGGWITGVVEDPTDAVIQGAKVTLVSADDPAVVAARTESGRAGEFRLWADPGIYTVVVQAAGFARYQSEPLDLGAVAARLEVRLKLPTKVEDIEVPGELRGGGTTLVLSRRDVHELPLDPAALLDELQELAGGPGAALFVGGFSGGKLPPRDSIREVRINQNAYSAENDVSPSNGVIHVSTRPGTDELHGQFYLYGDDSALNAGNPFAPGQPGYYADGDGGALSGSLKRRASYAAAWDQMNLEMNSAVDAQTLDASLEPVQVSYALRSPRTSLTGSSRLDLHAAAIGTMMLRYAVDREAESNGGIGQLALASQGFNNTTVTQTLQAGNTQVIGANVVNETRFQVIRARTTQTPASTAPAIVVEGAFSGGGNDLGTFSDHQDRYELENDTSLAVGRHYLNMGGRLRMARDANYSLENFGGEFIFATLAAYQMTEQGALAGQSIAAIQAAGGGASLFSLNAGSPAATVTLADAGLFVQDDWKSRENLTLSAGLRFETQTYIADHADWAPRAGFSWGLGKRGAKGSPTYVLHGGAGIFYQRFASASALQVERQNGLSRQEYMVASPRFCPLAVAPSAMGCPGIPAVSELAAQAAPTVYRVNAGFHSPYYIQESVGLDRRLGRYGTASVTYLNSRGVHTQMTENTNAPLPGTYDPANAASGIRPNGGNQNLYEFVSGGVYRSNRLTTNVTLRTGRFTAYGYYMLSFDKSDADSQGGFPSNPFNPGADYGRSLDDVRHTATLGENATLPWGIETWGYVRATSGAPFNIVVSQDLNGDTQFNDRPAFATDLSRPSVVATRWGTFDTSPISGQTIIPRNYGQGPGLFVVNLAAGKSFSVGPEMNAGEGASKGERKYIVELWVESQNLLNHPNLTAPVGTLSSPLFGRSLGVTGASSLSPDRVEDLQLSLRF